METVFYEVVKMFRKWLKLDPTGVSAEKLKVGTRVIVYRDGKWQPRQNLGTVVEDPFVGGSGLTYVRVEWKSSDGQTIQTKEVISQISLA